MCGIAGIVRADPGKAVEEQALLRMARSIRHRGPDGFGLLLDPGAGSSPPLDFSAARLPTDIARQVGDRDGDWNPDSCDGDLDNDGVVGQEDFLLLGRCVADPAAAGCADADVGGELAVSLPDLLLIGSDLGGAACQELQLQ